MMRLIEDEDLDSAQMLDIDEFVGMVLEGDISDSDGYCNLVYDFEIDPKKEYAPSDIVEMDIPDGVDHILWHQH